MTTFISLRTQLTLLSPVMARIRVEINKVDFTLPFRTWVVDASTGVSPFLGPNDFIRCR